jgi:hypothetical protein
MKRQFLGSTVALALGLLSLAAGLTHPSSLLLAGVVIVLGALAYRSRKRRLLRLVAPLRFRLLVEIVALIVALAAVLLQRDALAQMYFDPVPNVIIPIWIVLAYAFAGASVTVFDGKRARNNRRPVDAESRSESSVIADELTKLARLKAEGAYLSRNSRERRTSFFVLLNYLLD